MSGSGYHVTTIHPVAKPQCNYFLIAKNIKRTAAVIKDRMFDSREELQAI